MVYSEADQLHSRPVPVNSDRVTAVLPQWAECASVDPHVHLAPVSSLPCIIRNHDNVVMGHISHIHIHALPHSLYLSLQFSCIRTLACVVAVAASTYCMFVVRFAVFRSVSVKLGNRQLFSLLHFQVAPQSQRQR